MITLTHVEVNHRTPHHRPEQSILVNPDHIRTIWEVTGREELSPGNHTVITMGRQTILVKETPSEIQEKIKEGVK